MIFLGTGAAQQIPDPFCSCPHCTAVRESGDPREIRMRSSFLMDEKNLIDFGPDTLGAISRYGKDLLKLENLFLTHMHEDHFHDKNLDFIRMSKNEPHVLDVYLSKVGHEGLEAAWDLELANDSTERAKKLIDHYRSNTNFIEIEPYETKTTKSGMKVSALKTIHQALYRNELGNNYLFERNGKRFLYATDTGLYPEENYEFLKGKALDLLIMECTFGLAPVERTYNHLNCLHFAEQLKKLQDCGAVTENTEVWMTHFSHAVRLLKDDFDAYMQKLVNFPVHAAYDGLELKDF